MNSIIYKLSCNITGEDYYGSTNDYRRRITLHKTNTPKQNAKRKCTSRTIIDREDYTFSIVEECNFDTKKELLLRERYYIENFPCINIAIPYKTPEEKKEVRMKYAEENKEKMKEFYKQYRQDNRQRLNDMEKKRYHDNKVEINKKKQEKITCECGVIFSKSHRARHLKSNKHLRFENM